jgi:DNA-binding MarR family transcriptional regulator
VFDNLPASERRKILLASRIRSTPEMEIPRQRAIEQMAESALFVVPAGQWVDVNTLISSLEELSGLSTLQVKTVVDALDRLAGKGRVEIRPSAHQYSYRLTSVAITELGREFEEASQRLDRVLAQLYDPIGARPQSMVAFFLEVVCDFFSHMGTQWAEYLDATKSRAPIQIEPVEKLIQKKIEKFGFKNAERPDIARRTVYFFQHSDPDFAYLKFSLGQSYYVARLLGMEGKDYLAEEMFAGKTLYLDSSVVIPALLSASRHYKVFRELQKVCKRLGIQLRVARPTADEIRGVAACQEQIAPSVYDQVPSSLNKVVRGDFFHTYVKLKASDPRVTPADVFKPFANLPESIRTELDAEIVDDAAFAQLAHAPKIEGVKQVFQSASEEFRHVKKFPNALTHDAVVFEYLKTSSEPSPDQTWMVTRDVSLPKAWSKLQSKTITIRALLLDGLLQYVSPFILEEHVRDFSELFSEAITHQLLPQRKLFDIDDFMLLQDLEIDCSKLTDDEVQEGLHRVKQHVLHGASYRQEDFQAAAYEFRKYFAMRTDRLDVLTSANTNLEHRVADLETARALDDASHAEEINRTNIRHQELVDDLSSKLKVYEAAEIGRSTKRKKWRTFFKKSFCIVGLAGVEWELGKLALRYGSGENGLLRILSFVPIFIVAAGAWLLLVKPILFRREKLRDIFPTISEIKDLID